jgi:hypothetical protein
MARFFPPSTDLPRLLWVWSLCMILGIGIGAAALRAEDDEKKEAPAKYDPVEPKAPTQFNPDPGGRKTPVQSTSPAAAPLPSLFEPAVPTKQAEFAEDLPPRSLTLPRRTLQLQDERLGKTLEYPEYRQTDQGIGLLPGFTPLTDRWRLPGTGLGTATFQRYGKRRLESPYGSYQIYSTFDPYKPSLLKGDFPIMGEDIFLNLTLIDQIEFEARRVPTASGVSTARPFGSEFFGRGDGFIVSNNLSFTIELFKGETSFKPVEWALHLTPVFNVNYIQIQENQVKPDPRGSGSSGTFIPPGVNPGTINNPGDIGIFFGRYFIPTNVDLSGTKYTTRWRNSVNLQEGYFEFHLKDLSLNYDFISSKFGLQAFNADFRGFVFNDTNLGVRIFGNYKSNVWQYNLVYFSMREKDTFSNLNTFDNRDQDVFILNLFKQDFIWPGYTAQWSFIGNIDHGGVHYDRNGFLTRPAPIGTVRPHQLDAFYFGWAGDGHIGWVNITHAFYWVIGHDQFNNLAGRPVDINAQMFALELSYDRDFIRPKITFLYASGDKKATDGRATGFDSVLDSATFMGNPFSFFARQGIGLGNTSITTKTGNSLYNSLRSTKFEGQSNFVNPGTLIMGVGLDIDVTPRLKAQFNANAVRFITTDPIKTALFVPNQSPNFGYDLSFGFFYRPTLTQNIVITAGMGFFIPQKGFQDINRENTRAIPGYTNTSSQGKTDGNFNYSGIFAVTLTY